VFTLYITGFLLYFIVTLFEKFFNFAYFQNVSSGANATVVIDWYHGTLRSRNSATLIKLQSVTKSARYYYSRRMLAPEQVKWIKRQDLLKCVIGEATLGFLSLFRDEYRNCHVHCKSSRQG